MYSYMNGGSIGSALNVILHAIRASIIRLSQQATSFSMSSKFYMKEIEKMRESGVGSSARARI
jgi:hypothetical protein